MRSILRLLLTMVAVLWWPANAAAEFRTVALAVRGMD